MLTRIGTRHIEGEQKNAAIERTELMTALVEFDDPALIAAARTDFAAYTADPAAKMDPEVRGIMLEAISSHADTRTWEALHTLAKTAPTTVEQQEFYERMSSAIDPTLAGKALDLALSGEPPATMVSDLISLVGVRHPALAFDFAQAHWEKIRSMLEQGGDATFPPALVFDAPDLALAAKLQAFGHANIPASAHKDLRTAVSNMKYRAGIRSERLAEVDTWVMGKERRPVGDAGN